MRLSDQPGTELARREQIRSLVGRLSAEELDTRERSRALASLTRALSGGLRGAGAGATLSGRWLADLVTELTPHVPVRDLATLCAHHGGLTGAALAEDLVRTAARTTAAVGAAGGVLAAVELAAPPTLLAAPVQLTAETLAVIAIELKLVAELHVVHGRAPLAAPSQVAAAYLRSWASRRAVDPAALPGLGAALGAAARAQLRRRVARRLARNVSTMMPFLAGAVAGAELNRRETRSLGKALLDDLG